MLTLSGHPAPCPVPNQNTNAVFTAQVPFRNAPWFLSLPMAQTGEDGRGQVWRGLKQKDMTVWVKVRS